MQQIVDIVRCLAAYVSMRISMLSGHDYTDLRYVLVATEEIAEALTNYAFVVNKSIFPTGTYDRAHDTMPMTDMSGEFNVVSDIEFQRESIEIDDFMMPDCFVVSAETDQTIAVLQ